MQLREHVDLIREVFHYLQRFKDSLFVVKIDYAIIDQPLFSVLLKDLAMLHHAGIRVVLVPGAKERIDAICREYKISWQEKDGVRISSAKAIPFIKMAAFDVSNQIMTFLAGMGINAVVGNWVRARSLGVIDGVDFQQTGQVDRVQSEQIVSLLSEGVVPIFPCIGWNSVGKPYNISSNELAHRIAVQLKAEKLFFITDQGTIKAKEFHLTDDISLAPDGRISRLTTQVARDFLEANAAAGEKLELIRLACNACDDGVERVHIIDGRNEGVMLKEIFSNLGSGTLVHRSDYESIRAMKVEDISDVLSLMDPLVRQGKLVPRTREELKERYSDYIVYEVDGVIHGCAALHLYQDGDADKIVTEIAALATDTSFAHLGIGRKMVSYLLEQAKKQGGEAVFVLTTQTSDWFEQMGFAVGSIEDLPTAKQHQYNKKRASKVFVYKL